MITIICKGYRAVHEAEGTRLEIEEAAAADLLPKLIKRADAAARLAVSPRHFDSLVAKAGIKPVEGLPIRFREGDLLRLTLPAEKNLPVLRNVVPMPTPQIKTAAVIPSPTATTTAAPAQPRPKTKFRI